MTDYYSDADHIRDTLNKYGPLTRPELAAKTDLPRTAMAKSLYALKKQGDVIEEGDRLMLVKGLETARDEREEPEQSQPTTAPSECTTGENGGPRDDLTWSEITEQSEGRLPEPATDPRGDPYPAVEAMQAVSNLADYCRALTAELTALRDRVAYIDQLQADSDAYHALKAKLRDLSHE